MPQRCSLRLELDKQPYTSSTFNRAIGSAFAPPTRTLVPNMTLALGTEASQLVPDKATSLACIITPHDWLEMVGDVRVNQIGYYQVKWYL